MIDVRYLYEVTLCRHMNWKIAPMMKKPHKLPELLTHGEIQMILDNTLNLKHKTMFMLAYSAGLRISEIAHIRFTDIDSSNMRIFVKGGKGNKNRRNESAVDDIHLIVTDFGFAVWTHIQLVFLHV